MKSLVIAFLSVCFVACSSSKVVSTDVADNINWKNFKTFNFYNTEATGDTISEKFASRINIVKQAIISELQKKGLSQKTSSPDLLVNIGLVVQERVQTRQTTFPTDAPRYIGQRRYSWRSQEVEVGRYREGTLSVDIVDPKPNMLIWKGVVEGIIPNNEKKIQKEVQDGVTKLFQRFPEPIK